MEESEIVFGLSLPSGADAAVALEPGEEALDFPAPFVAAQLASIDLAALVGGVLGCDELDAPLCELVDEFLTAESSVADQLAGDLLEGLLDDFGGEGDVVFGAICNANGDWQTSAVCNRHDLRRMAGTTASDFGAPFLAAA